MSILVRYGYPENGGTMVRPLKVYPHRSALVSVTETRYLIHTCHGTAAAETFVGSPFLNLPRDIAPLLLGNTLLYCMTQLCPNPADAEKHGRLTRDWIRQSGVSSFRAFRQSVKTVGLLLTTTDIKCRPMAWTKIGPRAYANDLELSVPIDAAELGQWIRGHFVAEEERAWAWLPNAKLSRPTAGKK